MKKYQTSELRRLTSTKIRSQSMTGLSKRAEFLRRRKSLLRIPTPFARKVCTAAIEQLYQNIYVGELFTALKIGD